MVTSGTDRVQEIENIPLHPTPGDDVPDAMFGLFRSVIKFDHLQQLLTVTHNILVEKNRSLDDQYNEGVKIITAILAQLGKPSVMENSFQCDLASVQNSADHTHFVHRLSARRNTFTKAIYFKLFSRAECKSNSPAIHFLFIAPCVL